jgi:hypothetical protein
VADPRRRGELLARVHGDALGARQVAPRLESILTNQFRPKSFRG